jgi:hypothetical protein
MTQTRRKQEQLQREIAEEFDRIEAKLSHLKKQAGQLISVVNFQAAQLDVANRKLLRYEHPAAKRRRSA